MAETSRGYCQCGCGERTSLAPANNRGKGWVKGEPLPYVRYHSLRVHKWNWADEPFRCNPAQARSRRCNFVEEDRGYLSACWVWQGRLNKDGYGRVQVKGKTIRAHRYFFEELIGPIPEGLQLDHLCRVRACVNPDHVEPVTNSANQLRSHVARPGQHNRAKLKPWQVRAMRRAYEEMEFSHAHLARVFGIDKSTARSILIRETWRSI